MIAYGKNNTQAFSYFFWKSETLFHFLNNPAWLRIKNLNYHSKTNQGIDIFYANPPMDHFILFL